MQTSIHDPHMPVHKKRCPGLRRQWVSFNILLAFLPALLVLVMAPLPTNAAVGGAVTWNARDSQAGLQIATASVTDSNGNTYLTGYQDSNTYDYRTIKILPGGTVDATWTATFPPAGDNVLTGATKDDRAMAIALDGSENVIVAGFATKADLSQCVYVIKYDRTNGNVLWFGSYKPLSGALLTSVPIAIAIDGSNVYVTASSRITASNDDILLLKFDNNATSPNTPSAVTYDRAGTQDNALSIAASGGKVAITGFTYNSSSILNEILTLEYDSNLTLLHTWQHASSIGNASGQRVKFDGGGDIIVTGYDTLLQGTDIYTVKYQGASPFSQYWESRYPGQFDDIPTGLAIDSGNDVYVTGKISSNSAYSDFYTVKYDHANGNVLWESSYDSGSNADWPVAIALDGTTGDVYVTGYSNINGSDTIQTLKYKKESGSLLWSRNYGKGQDANIVGTRPVGIGIAPDGVYVAGWTTTIGGIGTGYDYYALKYEKGSMNRPTGLQVTTTSNVALHLAWTPNCNTHDGFKIERCTGRNCDFSVLDGGFPVTVGSAAVTYDDTPLAASTYYNYRVYAYKGAENTDYSNITLGLTVALTYGTPTAANTFIYDSPDHKEDTAPSVAVGPDNNPVVTGYSFVPAPDNAYIYYTTKLDRTNVNAGNILDSVGNPSGYAATWVGKYDSTQGDSKAVSAAVDNANNVFVAGTSSLPPAGGGMNINSIYLQKFAAGAVKDGSGEITPATHVQYNGPGKIDDQATQVVTDAGGNFIVVGHGKQDAINNHEYIYVLKYDSNANLLWDGKTCDNSGNNCTWFDAGTFGKATGVALAADGSVYVTGQKNSGTQLSPNYDYFTLKFCGKASNQSCTGTGGKVVKGGNLIWSDVIDSGRGDDFAKGLAIDAFGDVYISGTQSLGGGKTDFYTVKYSGSDNIKATVIWDGRGLTPDGSINGDAVAVAIDPNNNDVIVAGNAIWSGTDSDFTIARYKSDGTFAWKDGFGDIRRKILYRPAFNDKVIALGVDLSGNIYVAGNTSDATGTASMTIVYNPNGDIKSATRYGASTSSPKADITTSLAVNSLGEAFITGTTNTGSGGADNINYLMYRIPQQQLQAPSSVTVSSVTYTSAAFSWPVKSNTSYVSGYRVRRADNQTCANTNVFGATTNIAKASPTMTYPVNGLTQGTNYCYNFQSYHGNITDVDYEESEWVPVNITTLTPGAPTSVTATANNTTQVTLSGTVATTGQTSFEILRCTGAGCDFSSLDAGYNPKTIAATGSETTITDIDTTACPGFSYSYKIRAVGTGWSSAYSTASATTAVVPGTAITVTPTTYSESQINLSWNRTTTDETGFKIWRCAGSGCSSFSQIDTVGQGVTSYASSGLGINAIYRYKVTAYKNATCGGGWSIDSSSTSDKATAYPDQTKRPDLSNNLKSTFPAGNSTEVDLSWIDQTTSENAYIMDRCNGGSCDFTSLDSGFPKTLPGGNILYDPVGWNDTGACVSTTYKYRVRPANQGLTGSGTWAKSAPVTFTNFKPDFLTRVTVTFKTDGMAGDFKDIRFYDENARKELPYWIEKSTNGSSALVWIKTGTSSNVNIYYSNGSAASTSNAISVFGTGMMGFWPFSEADGTYQYSGGTTYDVSGLGNNLTMNGYTSIVIRDQLGLWGVPRVWGNSLWSNGDYGTFTLNSTPNVPTGNIMSAEAWIYPTGYNQATWNTVVVWGGKNNNDSFLLAIQNNGMPALGAWNNNFTPSVGAYTPATLNNWNHVAASLNGSAVTLWLNGQKITGTLPGGAPVVTSANLWLGSNVYSDYAYKGMMDDVRIYGNHVFTDAEITSRYAAGLSAAMPSGTAAGTAGNAAAGISGLWDGATYGYSNTLSVTVPAPAVATSLNAVANNEAQVTLTWTNKTADQTGFKIFRCAGSGCSFAGTPDYTIANTAAINTTVSYVDNTGLVAGTVYKYMVKAYKTGSGVCAWDSAADATPTNNTVTMPLNAPTSLAKTYSIATQCNDLRFTDSSSTTSLPYWIEFGCNTYRTKVHVNNLTYNIPKKVGSIDGSLLLNLYYGNPAAPAKSSGSATFDFFDDFSGSAVDTGKWAVTGTAGTDYSVGNGLLHVNTPTGNFNLISNTQWSTGYSVQAKSKATGFYYTYGFTPLALVNGGNKVGWSLYGNGNLTAFNSNYSTPFTTASGTSPAGMSVYDNIIYTLGMNDGTTVNPASYDAEPSVLAAYFYPTPGSVTRPAAAANIYLGSDLNGAATSFGMDWDWVRVRKASATIGTYFSLLGPVTPASSPGYSVPGDTGKFGVKRILNAGNNGSSDSGSNWQNSYDSISPSDSGTASSGTTITLADITKTWAANQWGGYYLKMTSGANNGLTAPIIGNTGTVLNLNPGFSSAIGSDTYQIISASVAWVNPSDSGTAASGSTTTLTDTGKTWVANQWTAFYLKMTSGANKGLTTPILSNTPTALTLVTAFSSAIANGDTYQIVWGNTGTFLDTTPMASDQITLTWANSTITEDGYRIERCKGTSATCTSGSFPLDATINVSGNGLTSYTDWSISRNSAYCYRVYATRSAAPTWTSPASAIVCDSAKSQQAPVLSTSGSTTQISLNWTEADFASDSNTATGGTTTVLNDTGKAWGTNQWTGFYLKITSGTKSGQYRQISSNTNNSITVAAAFTAAVAAGETYQIVPADGYGKIVQGIIGEYGYEIERCNDLTGSGCTPVPANKIATLGVNASRTYSDPICSTANNDYYYRLHVVKYGPNGALLTSAADGWPDYSNTVKGSIISPPAPSLVKATGTSETQITVSWKDNNSDESGFYIYRCKDTSSSACTPTVLLATVAVPATGTGTTVTYVDSKDIVAGGTYRYRVQSYGVGGACASWTSPSGTPDPALYAAGDAYAIATPAAPGLIVVDSNTTQVNVSWADNTTSEGAFLLERCTGAGCTDFSYINNVAPAAASRKIKAFYPFLNDAKDTSGNGLDLGRNLINTSYDPLFDNGGIHLNSSNSSYQSIVTTNPLDSGSSTSGTGYWALEDISKGWVADQWKGSYLKVTSGTNAGKVIAISGNTGTKLNLSQSMNPYPVVGDTYQIFGTSTGILDSEAHGIEFDFKIMSVDPSNWKVFFGSQFALDATYNGLATPSIWVSPNAARLDWVYTKDPATNKFTETYIGKDGLGSTSTPFDLNTWYHIRGEKAGSSLKIYLNGNLIGTSTVVTPQYAGNSPLVFGKNAGYGPADIVLKNFQIDDNTMTVDSSECAGTVYNYRSRAVKSGFVSAHVNITNFQASTPTRVTVPASIVAGRTVAQINDLRFYDYTAKADISYWIETVNSDGSATVWIKTGPTNTITLYANKNATGATYVSDGSKVFDFFDDFNGTTLDTSKWTATAPSGTGYTVNNDSSITIKQGAVYSNATVVGGSQNRIFEMKSRWLNVTGSYSGISVADVASVSGGNAGQNSVANLATNPSNSHILFAWAGDGSAASYNLLNAQTTGYTPSSTTYVISGIDFGNATPLSFFVKDLNYTQLNRISSTGTWNKPAYLKLGYFTGSTAGTTDVDDIQVDWVRVRTSSYPNPEPLGTIDTSVSFPTLNAGPGGSGSWSVSTPVVIAGFQPNFQTRLTVAKATLMNNDFSDLRFYDTTAQTELPYWIESKSDGVSATVWLKTGATNTIALYYGNSGALSNSSATTVFDFFDDFTTLDVSVSTINGNDPVNHRWSRSVNKPNSSTALVKGIAGSGSATSLQDDGSSLNGVWTADYYSNYYLLILSAADATRSVNAGQFRRIVGSSTGKLISTDPAFPFPAAIGAGDAYQIIYDATNPANVSDAATAGGILSLVNGSLYTNAPVLSSSPAGYIFEMKNKWSTSINTGAALTVCNSLFTTTGNGTSPDLFFAHADLRVSATGLQAIAGNGAGAGWQFNKLLTNVASGTNDTFFFNRDLISGIEFRGPNDLGYFAKDPTSYSLLYSKSVNTSSTDWAANSSTGVWAPVNPYTTPATPVAPYIFLGHVWGANGALGANTPLNVDWVRARKYAATEPQASVDTGQFPSTLSPGSGGSGTWTAGLLLTINNFQPNFQSRMVVNYISGMKTDFSDIRFYDATAKLELPYWIESYTASTTATVWLKTGANNNIAMYYGNGGATSTSSGANTFEFFDDFKYTGLGDSNFTSRWSLSDAAAGISLDGSGTGKLRINTGAVYSNATVVSNPQNYVYELKNQWIGPLASSPAGITVSDHQYFLGGNAGASGYAVNRLESVGSLRAQASDSILAGNNICAEYYPNSAGTTLAALNSDTILGIEFQGSTGSISYFTKDPVTYADTQRDTKSASVSITDTGKNWTVNAFAGKTLTINTGLNAGQSRTIASNTATGITVSASFPYFFTSGDSYQVLNADGTFNDNGKVTGAWNSPSYLFMGSNLGSATGTAGGGVVDITDQVIDWVRIRKFASPMPSVTVDAIGVNQAPAPEPYQILNNWSSQYSPVVTVITPQVANLVTNSDFETGISNWTVGSGASEDGTTAASGTKSMKITKSLAQNTSETVSMAFPQMNPGGSYTLSGNIKASLTNGNAYCRLVANNGSWDYPLGDYTITASPAISWNKTNNTIPANSDSTSTDGRIPLGVSNGGSGLSTSPYGTPTNRGDTGSVQGVAIIKEDATHYRMWYSGNDHGTAGAWRIYNATSSDGQTWTKVDSTLPPIQDSGTVPTNNNGRLGLGSDIAGIGDRLNVYVSSAVIKDVQSDNVTPIYKMWYTGHDRANWRIFYATSPDGLNWTKYDNTVPTASNTTGTNGRIPLGLAGSGDSTHTYAPTVVKDTSTTPATYKMWYSGHDGSYFRIYYATSTDGGLTWTKQNTTATAARDSGVTPTDNSGQIPLGSSGKGDDYAAQMPHVIWEGGSTFKMWYVGQYASAYNNPALRFNRILYATSNDGGLNWTKQYNATIAASDGSSGNYQITNGSAFSGDAFGASMPFVLKEGGGNSYTMWYSGLGGGPVSRIYRATTTDGGINWVKQDNAIPGRSDTAGSAGHIPQGTATVGDTFHTAWPAVLQESSNSYKMWYSASDGASWRLYYATSSDGLNWIKSGSSVPAVSDTGGTNGRLPIGSAGKGDGYHVLSPSVVKEDATHYKMWYSGHDGINWRGIYLATSSDGGLTWTKTNNTTFTSPQDTGAGPGGGRLFIGNNGDSRQVRLGSVVWEGGLNYKMWYGGYDGSYWRIYLATSTDGGLTWTKQNNTATAVRDSAVTPTDNSGQIPLGSAGKGDSNGTLNPSVYKDGSTYKMWYAGADGSGYWRIYYATSPDGLNWTKQDNSLPAPSDDSSINGRIPLGNDGKGDGMHIQGTTVIKDGSTFKMWYSAYDQSLPQRVRILNAVQAATAIGLNDNIWHSFSLPLSLKAGLPAADAAKSRLVCGISRDFSGTDGVDTANFDMIQLTPANPFNLITSNVSESQINLTWTNMTKDESGFRILRCPTTSDCTNSANFIQIATTASGASSFQDVSAQPGASYKYEIAAFKNGVCGWGASNNIISTASTSSANSATPTQLTAKEINTTQVDLAWNDVTQSETGFAVERSTDGITFNPLPPYPTPAYPTLTGASATTFSDTTACPATSYTYRVRSLNRGLSLDGGLAPTCTQPGDGWSKRRHLIISGFQPQYQTLLYVTSTSSMNADFSDLRFYDATAGKELPYWIESIKSVPAPSTARIWLKTGDNNNIDLYYGNTHAASTVNGSNVFDFFEDFSGTAIDTTKWSIVDGTGISVSGGYLHGTSSSGQVKSIATFPSGSNLELKAKAATWPKNPWQIGGLAAATYMGWTAYYDWNTFSAPVTWPDQAGRGMYYTAVSGGWNYQYKLVSNITVDATNFPDRTTIMSSDNMLYRVTPVANSTISVRIDELDRVDAQGKPLLLANESNSFTGYTNSQIVIGGSVANPGESMAVDWDWVRVRKYAAVEPSVSLDTETTSTPSAACFSFANQWGESTKYYSNSSNPVTTAAAIPPANLIATEVIPNRVDLTWQDTTADETGFEIQDCLDSSYSSCTSVTVPAKSNKYSATTNVWSKRVPVTIANFQPNFTTKVTVTVSDATAVKSDLSDIRFYDTAASPVTELPYWIESVSGGTATVWIKTGANNSVYMYYGNANGTSNSNGANVFNFFDDFNYASSSDGSFTSKWGASNAAGVSISNGGMTVTSGAVYSKSAVTSTPQNYVFEAKSKWSGTLTNQSGITVSNNTTRTAGNPEKNAFAENHMLNYNSAGTFGLRAQASDGSNTGTTLGSNNYANNVPINTDRIMGIEFQGSSAIHFYNKSPVNYTIQSGYENLINGTWNPAGQPASMAPYIFLGYTLGSSSTTTDTIDMAVDWVRVRPYAASEPSGTVNIASGNSAIDHCYRVRALKSGANASCTPPNAWPTDWVTPANACVTLSNTIQLDAIAQGAFSIKLFWNNVPNDSNGFEIEKKLSNGKFARIGTVGNVFTYTDRMGIEPLKPYTYRVRKAGSATTNLFTDNFDSGINPAIWSFEVGHSWRTADTAALFSNNAMTSTNSYGTAQIKATGGKVEFSAVSGQNSSSYNYSFFSLPDLTPVAGDYDLSYDFDLSLADYNASTSVHNSTFSNPNLYSILRLGFTSPATSSYTAFMIRSRELIQDIGKATSGSTTTIVDARTMTGTSTPWKTWATNQWVGYYVQMSGGTAANVGEIRKITGNTGNSITVSPAFSAAVANGDTYRINQIYGSASSAGTQTVLNIDAITSNGWTANQWAGMQLVMTGGLNAGQIRTIASNTTNTITVSPGFPVAISSGDGYQIIDSAHPAQEVYRISVTDPAGITDFTCIPTTDTTGRIRAVKTSNNDGSGSMMFYNASGVLLRKLDLPAPVNTTLVAVYQLGSKAENPGTTMKATMDNFKIISPVNANPNPYSNEAQVRTTSDGTPTGSTLLGNSTPAFVSGVDDKSNCTCSEQSNGKVTCTNSSP